MKQALFAKVGGGELGHPSASLETLIDRYSRHRF